MDRLGKIVVENKANVIIGIGGGKTLDVSKSGCLLSSPPVILFPTICFLQMRLVRLFLFFYKENGEFDKYLFFTSEP